MEIDKIYQDVSDYLLKRDKINYSPKAKQSHFWRSILKSRPNFPSRESIYSFRRSEAVTGIGDYRFKTLSEERTNYIKMLKNITSFVPPDFIQSIPEPAFGEPLIFELDGIKRSASFIINAGTTYRCKHLIEKYLRKDKLRICEIGAGWGGVAYQLHQLFDIENYTICDLPENLFLSSIYLSNCLGREYSFDKQIKGLTFMVPEDIDRIKDKYDIIINSFSMQEMDLETVESYIDWIADHLDGVFLFFNSHNKAGIIRPSQYNLDKFHISSFGVFRSVPTGLFNTIPYEVCLSPGRPVFYLDNIIDALGQMIQFGLNEDVSDLFDKFVSGTLAEDADYLEMVYRFFYKKSDIVQNMRPTVTSFLYANKLIADERYDLAAEALTKSLKGGLQGFAKVRAIVMMAHLGHCSIDEAARLAPGLSDEIKNSTLTMFRDQNRKILYGNGSRYAWKNIFQGFRK